MNSISAIAVFALAVAFQIATADAKAGKNIQVALSNTPAPVIPAREDMSVGSMKGMSTEKDSSALANLGAIYDNLQASSAEQPRFETGVGAGFYPGTEAKSFDSNIGAKVTSFQTPDAAASQQQITDAVPMKEVDPVPEMQKSAKSGVAMRVGSVVTAPVNQVATVQRPEIMKPIAENNNRAQPESFQAATQVDPIVKLQQPATEPTVEKKQKAPKQMQEETNSFVTVENVNEEKNGVAESSMQIGSFSETDEPQVVQTSRALLTNAENVDETMYAEVHDPTDHVHYDEEAESNNMDFGFVQEDRMEFPASAQEQPGASEMEGEYRASSNDCVEGMYACSADGHVTLQCSGNHWVVRTGTSMRRCQINDGQVLITG